MLRNVSECRDVMEGDVVVVRDETTDKHRAKKEYRIVTKEDVRKKRFRFCDVVIPFRVRNRFFLLIESGRL